MKLNDKMHDVVEKLFVTVILLSLATVISIMLISMVFYGETYESCLQDCREKYQLNIDNCWTACDESCNEKFGKDSK